MDPLRKTWLEGTVRRTVRRTTAAVLLIAAVPAAARAHPGSGLVVDRAGTAYFVVPGSRRIMRVTRDGHASVFLDDVRLRAPHHLTLRSDGALFVASDHDGVVWRIHADGTLEEHFRSALLPRSAPGFRPFAVGSNGDPFTVDDAGDIYAVRTIFVVEVVRISRTSEVTRLGGETRFGDLHGSSFAWGPDGALYLSDTDRVWRVLADTAVELRPALTWMERIRTRLVDLPPWRAMGLALDSVGNILVADQRQGRVRRLASDGQENTPAWIANVRFGQPTGVAVSGEHVYVLDAGGPLGGGVWRVGPSGRALLYGSRRGRLLSMLALPLLVALLTVAWGQGHQRRASSRNGGDAGSVPGTPPVV